MSTEAAAAPAPKPAPAAASTPEGANKKTHPSPPALPSPADVRSQSPETATAIPVCRRPPKSVPATGTMPTCQAFLWSPLQCPAVGKPNLSQRHIRRAVLSPKALNRHVVPGLHRIPGPSTKPGQHPQTPHLQLPVRNLAGLVFQVRINIGMRVDPLEIRNRPFHFHGMLRIKRCQPMVRPKTRYAQQKSCHQNGSHLTVRHRPRRWSMKPWHQFHDLHAPPAGIFVCEIKFTIGRNALKL